MTMAADSTALTAMADHEYDRLKELKQFDDTKMGVKGLVDAGITSIPRIFIQQSEAQKDPKPLAQPDPNIIPIIDLSGVNSDKRSMIVEQVSRASREFGFFQIVNHGVPVEVLDKAIEAIKAFHEQPAEVKAALYHREKTAAVSFCSNLDLFLSKAANWRDTLRIRLGSDLSSIKSIPEICKLQILEWDIQSQRVAELLMGLLCEGLGVDEDRLKKMTCLESRAMVGHYYPYCPQPDLTAGISSHTDPAIMTALLQDHIGGLQVKYDGQWVDVKPVPGAIVINIGELLQMISNNGYRSAEHRVLANPSKEPRISVAIFFNPGEMENFYGSLPELVSTDNPARYRQFTIADFFKRFFTQELHGKPLSSYYKL